jgi:hypothetical protein
MESIVRCIVANVLFKHAYMGWKCPVFGQNTLVPRSHERLLDSWGQIAVDVIQTKVCTDAVPSVPVRDIWPYRHDLASHVRNGHKILGETAQFSGCILIVFVVLLRVRVISFTNENIEVLDASDRST